MGTDRELQRDVMEELAFDPALDAAGIGVAVHDGVVTMNGHVPTYTEKVAAERAAKRISGVRAVANDLRVTFGAGAERDDTDLAAAALRALDWSTKVPKDAVRPTVRDGWVTLEGRVEWQFQREAAARAVQNLAGVRGITNLVELAARPRPKDVERRIQAALQRAASVDARQVWVETAGGTVILRGTVRSWAEREDAERAAWSVPGVTDVKCTLVVGPVEPVPA